MHQSCDVEQLAAYRHGEPNDENRAQLPARAGEALQLVALRRHEGAPLDQVLRRVTTDHLLAETTEGHTVVGHRVRTGDELVRVAARGSDRRVHRGQADLDEPHGRSG